MPERQNILVLGATGVSGLIFLRHVQSLPIQSRPALSLLVRNASKLPKEVTEDKSIRIVTGGLSDAKALDQSMSNGTTAVVSFLGSYVSWPNVFLRRTEPTPIADTMPAVFDAMRRNNVKRVLTLSTLSGWQQPGEETSKLPWSFYIFTIFFPRFIVPQGNMEMHRIAEQTRKQNDLDWTVYRVPHLGGDNPDKEVVAGLVTKGYRGTTELDRGSMVKWILQELRENKWIKQGPHLGNP